MSEFSTTMMAQTKVTFKNNAFEDYRLTPPGGAPVALRSGQSYTSTKTGTFTIARGGSTGTDVVIGAFGGVKSTEVKILEPSEPAKAYITNKSAQFIVLKQKGQASVKIPPGRLGKYAGERLGDYQVQTVDGAPIVKASLTGAVDFKLKIMDT